MFKLFNKLFKCNREESEEYSKGVPNGQYRFNTYDNMIGTTLELIKYFKAHVIQDRALELPEGCSIEEQLEKIKTYKDRRGTVMFLFNEGKSNSRLMETSYVMVRE